MVRAPNWTEGEFEIVLNSYGLSIEEVMQKLRSCRPEVVRTPGAIGFVRAGIHAYHPEKRNPGEILSKMMIRILEEKRDLREGKASGTLREPRKIQLGARKVSRPDIVSRDHRLNIAQALLNYRSKQKTGGPFTKNRDADEFLRSNPFAFLIAASIDRGALAEAVWEVPFLLNKKLGYLNPQLLGEMSTDQLETILRSLDRRPRFPTQSARTIISLSRLVFGQFDGDAAGIWENSKPVDVVQTLERIWGVGPGIAHMTVRILTDEFGYEPGPQGLRQIDIKPDIHVVRVFYRTGLVSERRGEACIEAARALNPQFPGLLDWPAWEIGRTWCDERYPRCVECPLSAVCLKMGI